METAAMRVRGKQLGMTFWSLLVTAAVAAFFVLIAFKLAPAYINNADVKTDLAGLASQPNAATMTKNEIHDSLSRRFEIDSVSYVDLRTDLHVARPQANGPQVVQIAYEVRVPLVYNVTALLDFNDTVQLGAK